MPATEVAPAGNAHAVCSVWWATPEDHAGLHRLLDDAERRRALRLASREDRVRYVTAHALVRLLLAARTGVPAADLRFDRTCHLCGGGHGKPRLVDARPGAAARPEGAARPVAFNLAHAGDRIVVAVADDHGLEIGVDVEPIPAPGAPVMATGGDGILTTTELATFREMPPNQRCRALATWWTRKEATLKATGDGLAIAPSAIAVTDPHERPRLTGGWGTARTGLRDDRYPVALHDLDAGPGYVGCVAAVGATSLEVTEHDAGPLVGAG